MADADARGGAARRRPTSVPTTPARCCAPGSPRSSSTLADGDLIAYLQADGFSHADLYRRARRCHERKLAAAGRAALAGGRASTTLRRDAASSRCSRPACPRSPTRRPPRSSAARSGGSPRAGSEPVRVALLADGVGSDARRHPHARRDPRARRPGLRGRRDRHRPARRPPAARGRRGRDPVLPRAARRRARHPRDRRRARRGPLRAAARVRARPGRRRRRARPGGCSGCRSPARTTPSWPPTRSCAPATRASCSAMQLALGAFYGRAASSSPRRRRPTRRSPSWASRAERIGRWDRGVDVARFSPARRDPGRFPADRVDRPLRRAAHAREGRRPARRRVPRRAGARPAAAPRARRRRARGGAAARAARARRRRSSAGSTGDELAAAYASADLFLFCSQTDTFGQVVLEAQASGLPVVAVAAGRPGRADRRRPQRAALPAARRGARRRGGRPRGLAGDARAAGARRPRRGAGAHLGGGARPARRGLAARARDRPRPTAATGAARVRRMSAADRGRDPRRRAGDVRALRADPRLARRPRHRPRDAARHPRARPAPVLPAPPRPRRLAAGLPRPRRRDRPARLPAPPRGRAGRARRGRVRRARRRRHAREHRRRAGACSRSPASSRAASSPPPTPTRPALRRELAADFDWWATLLRLVGRDRAALAPALSLRRSPLALRAGALAAGPAPAPRPAPGRLRPPAPRARARVGAARRRPPHRGHLRRPRVERRSARVSAPGR